MSAVTMDPMEPERIRGKRDDEEVVALDVASEDSDWVRLLFVMVLSCSIFILDRWLGELIAQQLCLYYCAI